MSLKISQLNALTTVLDTDVLPVVNSGETKKVTKANLLKNIPVSVSGEIPTGLINGSNTVYTTSFTFITASSRLDKHGLSL